MRTDSLIGRRLEIRTTLKGGRNLKVFVKNQRNQPLMPCSPRKAKVLLRQSKAKVIRITPFTIKLLYPTGETKQELTLGIDTGSSKIDFSNAPKGMKTPKMGNMIRIESRRSWIIQLKPLQFIL